ncbi:MATE family efflux transporter [Acinetobacter nosocomialis]|uniref:MATE family efflux transporter n=1 Tax=Acinetobacter nosocomialis TaxID=106654 RepID=UPI000DE65977|nr:MATE family efflux transporter [Acinetobacter nosocomialis]SSV74311.1 Na+-driven multidrug efflux pump [Acinetobacter nosocomialis]
MPPRQSLIHQQNLWKTFFVFLLPLIATNILQNLSGTINTIFVGQMMGVDAIAAVSVFFPILFLLLAFIIGISTGTTVLVGQAWGAQNIEKVQSVVGSTLFMTIIGGIITAIIGVFFAHDILELLGTDPKVMHLSLPYVQWMLAGSPLLFVYIIYTSILRGVGDSTTPLLALALTSVIGLVITPILLKGYFGLPALGIIAPAIATITGYVAILIFLAIYLNKKKHPLRPNRQLLQHIRHNPELSKIILRLGVPTGIQMITTSMAGLVIVGLVNRFGAHATAAYGAVNQVLNYIQFPALSISIAASIFAAQAIGAGKSDLLARVTRTALGMNFLFTGVLIALGYLFSKYLMALFITDPTVVVLGQQLLFIVLWAILFFSAGAIFASIMRASSTVTVPMLLNISAILLIEIPCAYWFSSMWGLKGIWIAYALAFVSLCIVQGLYYQFIWKKKKIKVLI